MLICRLLLNLQGMASREVPRFTEDSLCDQLSKFDDENFTYAGVQTTRLGTLHQSAILVPIFLKDGEPYVLLTVRSSSLRLHKGEVACPGGMRDGTDNHEIETCLREAEEEIGLKGNLVKIICHLPPRVTRHKTVIHPVVGLIPSNFVPVLNKAEVECVFSLPMYRFLSDHSHTSQIYHLSETVTSTIHFFHDEVDGVRPITWGLTANLLIELAIALFQEIPTYQYDSTIQVTAVEPFAIQKLFLKNYYGVKYNSKL